MESLGLLITFAKSEFGTFSRVWNEVCCAKMSDEEGKGTTKDGELTAKVIPDEPAALQELEDRLMDRLLHKVREESGLEELGEPKYVDTASVGKAGFPVRARFCTAA